MYSVNKTKKSIPKPSNGGGVRKYPFNEMKVGDSFDIEIRDLCKVKIQSKRVCVSQAAKSLGRKACCRLVDEGGQRLLRAWRVA